MTIRYPSKFVSTDASLTYTFSLHQMEAQFEQPMRTPMSVGVGSDYAHDHLGYGLAPRDVGSIRIRTISVETSEANLEAEIDEARSECFRIGKGWLYRVNQDASEQRCLARLRSMPSFTRSGFQSVHMPLIFDFVQLSDWQSTSATTGSHHFGPNAVTNDSFEGGTEGWTTWGGGAPAIARVTSGAKYGAASLEVTAAGTFDGAGYAVTTLADTMYTYSAWIYATAGGTVSISLTDGIDLGMASGNFTIPAATWTQISYTARTDFHTSRTLTVTNAGGSALTFLIDGVRLELGSEAGEYGTGNESVITITNAGNLPVRTGIVFSLTAISAAGWTNPEIFNVTTGEGVSTTRDSARIGDIWRIGGPDYKVGYGLPSLQVGKTARYVGYAAVGPQNYQNDFSLTTVTKGFPSLNPGANQIRIRIEGTPNATFAYSFTGGFS